MTSMVLFSEICELYHPWWWGADGQSWSIGRGKPKHLVSNLFQCHILNHMSHVICPGIEPGHLLWESGLFLIYFPLCLFPFLFFPQSGMIRPNTCRNNIFSRSIVPTPLICLPKGKLHWAGTSCRSLSVADLAVGRRRAEAAGQYDQAPGDFCGANCEAGRTAGPQAAAHCTPRGAAGRAEGLWWRQERAQVS